MHCGWDPHALLEGSRPGAGGRLRRAVDPAGRPARAPEAKVVHVGPDPLFARYPMRGFRTDIALTGAVAPTLQALWRARRSRPAPSKPTASERIARRASRRHGRAEKRRRDASRAARASITGKWLSACDEPAARRDTILVNEYPTVLEEMADHGARPLFRQPVGRRAGLGHGRGARRQARLPRQDRDLRRRRRRLHVRQPDRGALRVGGDAPAGAVHHRQQRAWGAVDLATRMVYPDGRATAVAEARFSDLSPSPDFAAYCRASGGHGETGDVPPAPRPGDRRGARRRAPQGRQVLLDVRCT